MPALYIGANPLPLQGRLPRDFAMNATADLINLVFLALAAAFIWRLWVTLGQRTGRERPPFDPRLGRLPPGQDTMPPPTPGPEARPERGLAEPAKPIWFGHAEEGSAVAKGLEAIAAADPRFAMRPFLAGARAAHEMIVDAYARGDKPALKPLLSREVYDGFAAAIDRRAKAGETVALQYVGIDRLEVTGAQMEGKRAILALRFVADVISATRSKAGEIIDGDVTAIRQITDVWTFERDVTARDPNWKLTATDDMLE